MEKRSNQLKKCVRMSEIKCFIAKLLVVVIEKSAKLKGLLELFVNDMNFGTSEITITVFRFNNNFRLRYQAVWGAVTLITSCKVLDTLNITYNKGV